MSNENTKIYWSYAFHYLVSQLINILGQKELWLLQDLTEFTVVVGYKKYKHTLRTMPVGRCFRTTQLFVLLTAWPPGPCPRTYISSSSFSSKGGYSKSSECFSRTQCKKKLLICPLEGSCCNGHIFTLLWTDKVCNKTSQRCWLQLLRRGWNLFSSTNWAFWCKFSLDSLRPSNTQFAIDGTAITDPKFYS